MPAPPCTHLHDDECGVLCGRPPFSPEAVAGVIVHKGAGGEGALPLCVGHPAEEVCAGEAGADRSVLLLHRLPQDAAVHVRVQRPRVRVLGGADGDPRAAGVQQALLARRVLRAQRAGARRAHHVQGPRLHEVGVRQPVPLAAQHVPALAELLVHRVDEDELLVARQAAQHRVPLQHA